MKVKAWKAHEDIVMCLQFLEGFILSGAKDNLLKLWKVEQMEVKLLTVYHGHTDNVVSISFSPKDI
jgi:WD40 repeat protein